MALDDETLGRMAQRARPLLAADDYEHDNWMFGRKGDPEWPRHAGYALGYALVSAWLKTKALSPGEAAGVPATAIVDDWLAGRISVPSPSCCRERQA